MHATHKEVSIHGTGGELEGLLWVPHQPDEVRLAAVVCHPHPLYQGTMHNKVVYRTAKALDSLGIPVLRFNFRGVGTSGGSYDRGRGEEEDVRSAIDYLEDQFAGVPLLVAGFSFGAWVGLRAGCMDARVIEMIGLGLPIDDRKLEFSYLRTCTKPKLLIQGENDQYAAKAHFEDFAGTFSPQAATASRVVFVRMADHFFTDHLDEVAGAIHGWMRDRHPDWKPPHET
ncbi:MAG TPA: alpha/beta family hydrolase [Candidatus Acidoferrales bacterium]|jgi:alpha/beta superfamily hydrolase|nr:alpha/beta family hydrolase [Candidatus Acidoferrales bacterium]